ncbi:MAG: sigma-70 family RNA polymerase sigma factor [Treponema sp.]|nr:sigma-70 family RNA polymerase sigma factor [Treponema sp.]
MEKQKADKLILKYSQKIFGFAMKKAFSYEEAEELSGEMLKEVYLSFLKAEDIVNVEGYVWRICEHVYAKYVNQIKLKQGLSIDGGGLEDFEKSELAYFDEYDFGQTEAALLRLRKEIGFLSSCRRQIVYSFYYEGKSIVQISEEQGLPQGTVKWHLNKARNDLKEGINMRRQIGKLGLSPIKAINFSHDGRPGSNGGPDFYLGDKLNLNIVYSVYDEPKTQEEIAEDLGMTPVFLEDKIDYLVANGFLVEEKGKRYTTYVRFSPEEFSMEAWDRTLLAQTKVADILVEKYVPQVRKALQTVHDVYIPGGNRELFEAAVIFLAISRKCRLPIDRNLSRYFIKPLDGGFYIASVDIKSKQIDPKYKPLLANKKSYNSCGEMTRDSKKYPCVYSWSIDSRFDNRKGAWQNNLFTDYESVYEIMTGAISDTKSNSEKFARMKERKFIGKDGRINIMIVKGSIDDLLAKIPEPEKAMLDEFADFALEQAAVHAKTYPPQMQDLVFFDYVRNFISNAVSMMVLDKLYENGTFRPLTEQEKVTANLLMFADQLPD